MPTLYETAKRYFEEANWPISEKEGGAIFSFPAGGTNGKWTCYARAREEQRQFLFYSLCPINVPDERRTEMARFLCRANFGLLIGNFEIDLNDGEIRYKTSIDVDDEELTPKLIKPLLIANVSTMDRYLPGIISVVGGATAEEAVASVESGA